jgi:NADH-quinone oxidoreductase subunit D
MTARPSPGAAYTVERDDLNPEILTINMGPSHPSTHGVLRLVLKLDGERVVSCVPDLGYLHRGMEKIAENKTYHQFIPYTDRLDYLAPLSTNVAYVLAVEKLMGLTIPPRGQVIRVICCEIARISSHLLWLGTHALDLGAATVFFHTFREREVLYTLIEQLTGARLTTSYTRVGGLACDLPDGWTDGVRRFVNSFPKKVDEFEKLLTRNRIWMDRTQNVGVISKEDAIAYGVSGPNLRAAGVEFDLRKAFPYSSYEQFDFEIPTGTVGDIYDRYLVRMEEMRQATRILDQALRKLPGGPINNESRKVLLPDKTRVLTAMEDLIHQFMLVTEALTPPPGEVYHAVEAPKGEVGFYICSTGGKSPYRLRIRSASFCNLHVLSKIVTGGLVADVVATIASLDPVMGEVDR